MEFKKKTLIWETNTEPPKNYIWIKEDGKAYEYDYSTKRWIESKIVSSGNSDVDKKFKIIEETLGVTLEPNIDEKYYQYFTIEATEDDTVVYFRQSSYAEDDGIAPLKVEVSTDDGEKWQKLTAALAEDDVPGTLIGTFSAGDKILVRGDNEAYGYHSSSQGDSVENCNFWADKPCYVYGNIMSLISRDNFARLRKVKEGAFAYFFSDYDESLPSWVLSKEEERLLLPATALGSLCYYYMFNGCSSLMAAPDLPATTLENSCYQGMFSGCSSLTTAPELPATTLAKRCYFSMFNLCTSLTTAPSILPATILTDYCYNAMFLGCTSLNYIKAMFTTTPGAAYTADWVNSVAGNGTFVKNSAATWDVTGVNGVPTGWTVETADA